MPPICSYCRRGHHYLCWPVWKWGDRKVDGDIWPDEAGKTFKEPYQVACECPKKNLVRIGIRHPLTPDFLQYEEVEA